MSVFIFDPSEGNPSKAICQIAEIPPHSQRASATAMCKLSYLYQVNQTFTLYCLRKEYQKFINVNEQINIGDYQISFDKIETLEKNNFQSLKGSFSILEKNKKIAIVEPEKRFYYVSKMITTEAAIYHTILKDFYLVLGEKTNNGWSIIVYENPLVLLIWIGAFIMMISGLSTVWRK